MNKDAVALLLKSAEKLNIALTPQDVDRFSSLGDELKKWTRKMNLTAITGERDIVIKHFIDSLTLLDVIKKDGNLLDIGSGAGFPALPVKIVLPYLTVVSVDSVEKKVLFQRHVSRLLNLHDYSALHARGEDLAKSHTGQFDYVVSRAFSNLPYFVSLALPLVRNEGCIISMKGKEGLDEARAAKLQLAALGVEMIDCVHIHLPDSGGERYVLQFAKTGV
jgi:16S rRNA (guanine527-N7)-methyltransferase